MGAKIHSPAYLVQQSSGYCFRIIVPRDLRSLVGKREFRYALRTGLLSEAKYRALRVAGFVQGLFREIRKGGKMRELTEAEIQGLVRQYLTKCLEDDERYRVVEGIPLPPEVHEEQMLGLESIQDWAKQALADCAHEEASKLVDRLLKQNGLTLDPHSYSYNKLCREVLKASVKITDILKKREVGDYPDEIPIIPASAAAQPGEQEPSELLSKVISLYIAEQVRGGNWSEKSTVEYTACLMLLKEYLGDIPIKSIDYKMMREYKEALLQLPPNIRKSPKYRGKTVHQILEMNVVNPMATATVNKHLTRTSSLFDYAVNNGFIDRNLAARMQVREAKKDSEFRDPFDSKDLRKLFHSKEYLEDTHSNSYCFWLPVLGLYTGCRLEELCQLHLDDIQQVDGLWVININLKDGKRVKTKAGLRVIPLHSFLVEGLNLSGYAGKLRAEGNTRLFPELHKGRDGYGKAPSRWFNERYKVRCGIVEKGAKKDFHSFRHTFDNALKQAGVLEGMAAEVAGHSGKTGIDYGRYAKGYQVGILFEQVIKKLDYDVDLTHLTKSKYVVTEGLDL